MRQTKDAEERAASPVPVELAADQVELILCEADRALMWVDARTDEPGSRVVDGVAPEDIPAGDRVAVLSLAIAQLIDGCPALQLELEAVSDRLRTHGASVAVVELAACPQLVSLVRLSLESLFEVCPDEASYLSWLPEDAIETEIRPPNEVYLAYRDILTMLRSRLS